MTECWVDVSHWQGNIDWSVLSTKVDGVIIKMSEYQADDKYMRNVEGALETGTRFASYHFWHDTVAWKDQLKLIKKLNVHKSPVCLDVEGQSFTYVDKRHSTEGLMNLVRALKEEYRWYPTIYTRKTIWDDHITASILWDDCPLWVANYGVNKPAIPRDWRDWHIWQYSNTGNAKEYGAPVKFIDLNHVKQEWINYYYWPPSTPPAPTVKVPDTLTATVDGKQYTWRLQ